MIGLLLVSVVFFQAEDGIRDLVRSRGLGDVYKRQAFPGEDGGAQQHARVVLHIYRANHALTVAART